MPLNSLEQVRSLIGDMDKVSVREKIGKGPVVGLQYQTDAFPIKTGVYTVFVSGVARASATASITLGIIDFSGVSTAVTAGAAVTVTYTYQALSDQEIQSCIDIASGGGTLLAAAYAARAIAANASRWFSYSQGNKSINKDNVGTKMLQLAESLEDAYEKNISLAGYTMRVTKFDDSGTAFVGYDTATSRVGEDTGTWPLG